jgi:hypothetical protein
MKNINRKTFFGQEKMHRLAGYGDPQQLITNQKPGEPIRI